MRKLHTTPTGSLPDLLSTTNLSRHVDASVLEAYDRLKSIQIANEVATWTWDILTNRVVADQNLAGLFGVSPEDASGAPIEKYINAIHPDDRRAVQAAIAEALEGPDEKYQMNYRIVRKNGESSWVSARGKVERDPDGKPPLAPIYPSCG